MPCQKTPIKVAFPWNPVLERGKKFQPGRSDEVNSPAISINSAGVRAKQNLPEPWD
jgi:hypothetical protein